jgi:hypothetical protein
MALFAYLRKNGDNLIAALAGFCIIIYLTRHGGIGVSPDSVRYISVAENLGTEGALKDFSQVPLMDFPAFYPIFLRGVMLLTGLKPLIFGPVLNALLFALVIYLAGIIMNHFRYGSRWLKLLLLSCIVLSPSLQEIYTMLWSETIFLLLLLLLIIALYRYYRVYSLRMVLVLAFVAGLSCVTRYAGIGFIVTAGFLLLVSPGLPWRKRLLHFAVFLPSAAVLPAINIIHNTLASGTMTGYREPAIQTLMGNITDVGSVFSDWLPFLSRFPSAAPVVAILLITALGIGWLWRLIRNKDFNTYETIATGFFLSYTVFMIISASLSRYQPLDDRLLCPAFIPLLWSIGNWIMTGIQHTAASLKKVAIVSALLLFGCFQYKQWTDDSSTWFDLRHAGIPGYTEDTWKLSETIHFIQSNKAFFKYGYGVYSNANDALWFFTGMKSELLPHNDFPSDIKEFEVEKHCYVVWFNDGYNPDLVGLDFISNVKKMVLYKQLQDGAIYVEDSK